MAKQTENLAAVTGELLDVGCQDDLEAHVIWARRVIISDSINGQVGAISADAKHSWGQGRGVASKRRIICADEHESSLCRMGALHEPDL